MTTLPTRNTLSAIGASYGQVRTALGDMRDVISEALGNSGLNPVITNATLSNVSSLGIRTSTPGADLQIFGGVAITASAAAGTNPGDGSLYLDGKLQFSQAAGTKLSFPQAAGNPLEMGVQVNNLFYRTKINSAHVFYSGGLLSPNSFDPGTGGLELLRLSDSEFKYKGNTIYHSGNGVFLRKDVADTAIGNISFTAGATISSSTLTLSGTSSLAWTADTLGVKAKFYSNLEDFSLGVQANTLFLRTGGNFVVYRGGSYSTGNIPDPGTNGETLFQLSASTLRYRGQDIYHTGNSNFVPKTSAARPGVTQLFFANEDTPGNVRADFNGYGDNRVRIVASGGGGGSLETRTDVASYAFASAHDGRRVLTWESNIRAGAVRLYRCDADEASYIQTYFDNNGRYFLEAKGSNGDYIPVRVARSDSTGYADNAGYSNRTGGIHGNAIDDGTVRYWEISRAEATATNTTRFGVHDYAFSSPLTNYASNQYVVMGNIGATGDQRAWSILQTNTNPVSGNYFTRWQYITGSGDPYTWVVTDTTDGVVATYDAEDPFDRDNPETNPIFDSPQARLVILPNADDITKLVTRQLERADMPSWVGKHKFKDAKNPRKLFRLFLKDYCGSRQGMKELVDDEDMDLNTFVLDLTGDDQKKNWRKQAILRAASKVLLSSPQASIHEVLQKYYKVNKKGNLVLK